jgi:hypothetical protein
MRCMYAKKNQNPIDIIFAAVNLPRDTYAQLLVVIVVLSVEEEDLTLEDAARVVVVALDVVELALTLLELEALVDVETDALRVLESETDVNDPDTDTLGGAKVVELDDADTVELTEPEVDEPGEFPEPGVAVCQ